MNDSVDAFFETATFCKTGDNKRPGFVGTAFGGVNLCDDDLSEPAGFRDPDTDEFTPATVADGVPTGWYIRLEFDELLDPTVEELLPVLACSITGGPCADDTACDPTMANDKCVDSGVASGSLLTTQPVILKCGGNVVAYDGYYSPSGNNVTWPVGPSLVVQPVDASTVATGSECTVELKDTFTDKAGNAVPVDQRGSSGEIKWGIAALAFLGSAPAPAEMPGMEEVIAPDSTVVLSFNAFIDATSLDPATAEVTVREVPVVGGVIDCAAAGTPVAAANVVVTPDAADPLSIDIGLNNAAGAACTDCAFKADTAYVIEFSDTNEVADVAGGPGALPGAADFSLCFLTDAAP